METPGHASFAPWAWGSIAERVLRWSTFPGMLVRPCQRAATSTAAIALNHPGLV